jgi:hypothetical protein
MDLTVCAECAAEARELHLEIELLEKTTGQNPSYLRRAS